MSDMQIKRRAFGALLCALAVCGAAARPAEAQQAYPDKPIRLIVPYAAGGFADTRARKLAEVLNKSLGVNIIVDNRTGAGGVLGTDAIAKAEPDGYTIGMGNLAPLSVNPTLMKKLPYDVKRDLAPVILLETGPLILTVGPDSPAKTVRDLIAMAKDKPGTLSFASSGIGGAHHLSGEMFRDRAAIDIVHVPYRGGAPAAADLMAGHVPMMFEMGYAALPSIRAGKIRAIAVTSSTRLAVLPDVPTMAESGLPGFESYNWQGIVVPAATPRPIIDKLNRAFNDALADPAIKRLIVDTGSQIGGGTPEAFAKFIASESDKWGALIKSANIKPE
ncbi:tripartite tricarboxylate transporter substrate binding protein [soil metagenome]